jgi:hypothetical protein
VSQPNSNLGLGQKRDGDGSPFNKVDDGVSEMGLPERHWHEVVGHGHLDERNKDLAAQTPIKISKDLGKKGR